MKLFHSRSVTYLLVSERVDERDGLTAIVVAGIVSHLRVFQIWKGCEDEQIIVKAPVFGGEFLRQLNAYQEHTVDPGDQPNVNRVSAREK
jgi:hypothetical protein